MFGWHYESFRVTHKDRSALDNCLTWALSLVFSTSSVYCLVSDPHPHPWTWKDGLYKVKECLTLTTWADHCSWANEKQSFTATIALDGHCQHVHFYQPKEDSQCFFYESSSKKYCKTQFPWACSYALILGPYPTHDATSSSPSLADNVCKLKRRGNILKLLKVAWV